MARMAHTHGGASGHVVLIRSMPSAGLCEIPARVSTVMPLPTAEDGCFRRAGADRAKDDHPGRLGAARGRRRGAVPSEPLDLLLVEN